MEIPEALPPEMYPVIVTDLDGTLLDHHDYSFTAAQPALALIEEQQIPLILNSSKTAAEIKALRMQLGNTQPFVTENGGGIFISDSPEEIITLGGDRADILLKLHALRREQGFNFTGFSDMSTQALMDCTGLNKQEALAACDRQFTEPLLWQDSEARFEQFSRLLEGCGLAIVKGGRFFHVSAPSDKGRALDYLREYYQPRSGRPVFIVALGDGNNDRPMLEAADLAVVIPSPVNALPEVANPAKMIPDFCGPAGWNQALLKFLNTYNRH